MPPRHSVETPASVRLPGGDLDYVLRRSARARRLRISIDPRRGVIAVVPGARTSETRARALVEPFLVEREVWLRRHLARQAAAGARTRAEHAARDGAALRYLGEWHRLELVRDPAARRSRVERSGDETGDVIRVTLAAGEKRDGTAILEAWLRQRARAAIEAALATHAPALGVTPAAITIRDTRSRWGSASRAHRLSFSWRLVLAPPRVLETVVVHELAHLRVFGHGPRFWAVVAGRIPDHMAQRRWLRTHAAELHLALTPAAPPATGEVTASRA